MTQVNATTNFIVNDANFNMIEQQIRTWDVLDPVVLDLFNTISREKFVSESQKGLAFADVELPIGHGQTMLSPKIEGKILQSLQIKPTEKVLVIGTGSGYLTALAATLANSVIAIEIHAELAAMADKRLKQQSIHHVRMIVGDGIDGVLESSPYDVIIYTGSLEMRAKKVERMLTVGGRLFSVIGTAPIMQATLTERVSETVFKHEAIFETSLPPMINAAKLDKFEF